MRLICGTTTTRRGLRPGRHRPAGSNSQLLAVLAGAAAFAVITRQATQGRLDQLDQAVMTRLLVWRRPAAAMTAALTISAVAEPAVVAAALAMCGVAGRADCRTKALACFTVASGAAARHLVAGAVARPRPPKAGWRVQPSGFSLPSRHTTTAMLAAGACARCADMPVPAAWLLPAAAAGAVGASRVYLGVHWPGDILAAGMFALTWLAAADAAARSFSAPASVARLLRLPGLCQRRRSGEQPERI